MEGQRIRKYNRKKLNYENGGQKKFPQIHKLRRRFNKKFK